GTANASVPYDYTLLTGASGLNKTHFVQGSHDRMVTAALYDESTLWLYTWKDWEPNATVEPVEFSKIVSRKYTATDPDGIDWYGVSFPGNITSALLKDELVSDGGLDADRHYVFAFDAGVDAAKGRPQPYVRILTVRVLDLLFGTVHDVFAD